MWCSLKPIFIVKQCRGAKNLFLLSVFITFALIKTNQNGEKQHRNRQKVYAYGNR